MVKITQRLDKDDHYMGGNTKQYIVIHDTGNATDSDEGNANYFCTGKRNASAHYFVDNNSITQVVLDNDCAFHVGDGKGKYGITNKNSLGVEQCRVNGVITSVTVNNTLDLVVILMKKYGIPESNVVRHYDASRKNCPASFNSNSKWSGWDKFKKDLHDRLNPEPVFEYGIVTADSLNVRSGAGTQYPVIGSVKKGEKVKIDKLTNKWYSIYYGTHGGFISSLYVTKI